MKPKRNGKSDDEREVRKQFQFGIEKDECRAYLHGKSKCATLRYEVVVRIEHTPYVDVSKHCATELLYVRARREAIWFGDVAQVKFNSRQLMIDVEKRWNLRNYLRRRYFKIGEDRRTPNEKC